jgi:DNA-binding GntR family transcriptional regulator
VLRACIERGPDRETLRLAIGARSDVECVAAGRVIESAGDGDLRLLAARIDAMERAADSIVSYGDRLLDWVSGRR